MSQTPLALQLPLQGSQLIEASAGTGKTYTISAVYLRLVLGHGTEQTAFARPLLPPEILVVTFTDAATAELKDRIRQRLIEAAKVFRLPATSAELVSVDPLLIALRDDFAEQTWSSCAYKLELAAQWMDQAAISTIHAWCQRMLHEHAFDSGYLFKQTLETDFSELEQQVAEDYWREFCYPLTGDLLEQVIAQWQSPAILLKQVRPLLGRIATQAKPVTSALTAVKQQAELQAKQQLHQLKTQWQQALEAYWPTLEAAVQAKHLPRKHLEWLGFVQSWALDPQQATFKSTSASKRDLAWEGFQAAWKGAAEQCPAPSFLVENWYAATLEQLDRLTSQLPEQLLKHAATWIAQRFEQEKQQRSLMGFDDMLNRLDTALQGENAQRLAETIRQQFPVAMIDEFQDTDPVQYRIFNQVYAIESNQPETAILLIGDPKQAIYSFRGADIYTYLQARRATESRHHTLDTNYRSSQAMVDAVNYLFAQAEQREAKGAFLFDKSQHALPFHTVQAKGRAAKWTVNGEAAPALTCWLNENLTVNSEHYLAEMAASCATEITRLLTLGQTQQAGFVTDETFHGLKPGDIAILVRSFNEAEAVRRELAERKVRSVYLSDRDSVFSTSAAQDLWHWLNGFLHPQDDRLIRAALTTSSLNLSLPQLHSFVEDEVLWEQQVLKFRRYYELWQKIGVLPAIRQFIHDYQLPEQLANDPQRERKLTDILHLAEVLQRASSELDSEWALLRFLEGLIDGDQRAADDYIVRLESDAELVKVVTIHKSKGLEYPLVFLPFICRTRQLKKGEPYSYFDGQARQYCIHHDEESFALAEQDRQAEDLRLLYVALTRAQYACWLGMADVSYYKKSVFHASGIGYLLNGLTPLAQAETLETVLTQHQQQFTAMQVLPAPTATARVYAGDETAQQQPIWLTPQRAVKEHWWIASYSALKLGTQLTELVNLPEPIEPEATHFNYQDKSAQAGSEDSLVTELADQHEALAPFDDQLAVTLDKTIHQFPKGPTPGTFLHNLFEIAGEHSFVYLLERPGELVQLLERRCAAFDWQDWVPTLTAWLSKALSCNLPITAEGGLRLKDLTQYQVEMEFWFEAQRVNVLALDRLVQQYEFAGELRLPLEPDRLHGMFKGFIDLTFEHQGQYYVADYKSNWLGEDDTAYTQAAMQSAILQHRYDLQYVLYLLALHRLLKLRLPNYDYDQHIGGAVYWFVRGINADSRGVFSRKPPRQLIEQLDALFKGRAPEQLLTKELD
ncbi:exodeoxyribonuclease V subunit beta [Thiopseudomonas alkaliphila]|uniref:exodeoxyribonuclease V subunit beta n=1 Tax=Thiopseudomonas alkaliphila TaxID=1697053 RepID=UPI0025765B51|nr:exodeoxyribonuclease V subunit beta [Thiopseudomonas alkaliphila]MDM1715776.1 exodeoxyribonuclease V subunit beta [Thiopseudomonas alkaliphila]